MEDFAGAKFYCPHALGVSASTYGLGTRHQSSPQWCYLHHLYTMVHKMKSCYKCSSNSHWRAFLYIFYKTLKFISVARWVRIFFQKYTHKWSRQISKSAVCGWTLLNFEHSMFLIFFHRNISSHICENLWWLKRRHVTQQLIHDMHVCVSPWVPAMTSICSRLWPGAITFITRPACRPRTLATPSTNNALPVYFVAEPWWVTTYFCFYFCTQHQCCHYWL